jgi:hypothetical protein
MYYGNAKEVDYVDADRHQAVFLTNGQVYFGKVKTISKQYIDLRGIYYLNVKLGCELHGPVDQMLVNRDQVTFWENLKDDGQVAKAIDQWVKENPNGQQCANADTSTGGDADAAKP